jgi:tetratricopeptide (TPR) repeat protein
MASSRQSAIGSFAGRGEELAEAMQPDLYGTALQHYEAGRLDEASEACGRLLNGAPRNFQALSLLGRVRSRQGNLDEAAFFLTAALGVGSSDAVEVVAALDGLAAVHLEQHQSEPALECYRRALAISPDDADTLYHYGNALYAGGSIDEAIDVYRRGLAGRPDFAEIHNNLGNALRAAGMSEEAAVHYRRAVALRPDCCEAHNNLGQILFLQDRADEAAACHRDAVAANPDDAASLVNLGNVLQSLKQFDEASALYRRALVLAPGDTAAQIGLGFALLSGNRFDEAIPALEAAVAAQPMHGVARMALGTALVGLNRYGEALQQYRNARPAMQDSPLLMYNEATALLATGAWPEGWKQLEARFRVPGLFQLQGFPDNLPIWRGDPAEIAGSKILLQAEQGLGDTLQFVRYVPLVAELGAQVVLRVQPRLGRLLDKNVPTAERVITTYDEPPAVDLLCPLMSLPAAFETRIETIPAAMPYIHAPAEFSLLWQTLLGPRTRPRIGIVWSGMQHMPARSMPLQALTPLLQLPGYEFHSLQLEIPPADGACLAAHPWVVDHRDDQKDFADTAGLIEQMDLVVTIDTSVAHLAGAMARSVWIMLPFNADFRWLLAREDTPWYPTARLFRQKRPGDWDGVIAEVVKALG